MAILDLKCSTKRDVSISCVKTVQLYLIAGFRLLKEVIVHVGFVGHDFEGSKYCFNKFCCKSGGNCR